MLIHSDFYISYAFIWHRNFGLMKIDSLGEKYCLRLTFNKGSSIHRRNEKKTNLNNRYIFTQIRL